MNDSTALAANAPVQRAIAIGGFWFGGDHPPVCSAKNPRALCHTGQGGSIGWADPDAEPRLRTWPAARAASVK